MVLRDGFNPRLSHFNDLFYNAVCRIVQHVRICLFFFSLLWLWHNYYYLFYFHFVSSRLTSVLILYRVCLILQVFYALHLKRFNRNNCLFTVTICLSNLIHLCPNCCCVPLSYSFKRWANCFAILEKNTV